MLDEGLGELHRADQVDLQDAVPLPIVGLAERRMMLPEPRVAQENVDGLAAELARKGVDRREIGDIELEHAHVALDRACGVRRVGIETGREDSVAVGSVLTGELGAEPGITAGDQNGWHAYPLRFSPRRQAPTARATRCLRRGSTDAPGFEANG